ncbi:MAG TPA: glycoside hydrolase family 2 TIM barrel-domain containing protein [Candidatus Acidoferrum sp.]|nr:glycoside hydrolase family 2 TIM barrel-domain containing protein [Candidatus Acidoferrum sp.]
MNVRASLILTSLAICGSLAAPELRASVPIPDDSEHVMALDGKWRFKLEQAPPPPSFLALSRRPIPIQYPTNIEPFYMPGYCEDAAWHDLAVPGNWEMAGYSPATYDQPDNASGLYRLKFKLPAKWKDRRVIVNFDGVQNGCEVWCNGQPVCADECSWGSTNYHEGGWTAWQADLTPVAKFGQANLLALRVVKNTRSVDCDTGDFFFLGGIHRPVTLFSVPACHVRDLTIRTRLLPQDSAEVAVIADLEQPAPGTKVSAQLEGQPAVDAEPDSSGRVNLAVTVPHPRLWSAESPSLYALAVEVKGSDGKVVERVARRVGIREVSIQNGVFCVNHVPVKLVGICRHDVYPTLGTAINADIWRKDLTLMKAANFNAVRTSHYPYGSGFYDLCDEMGFYVLDEEPFCWVNCSDTNLTAAFAQRARETVRRDKNHPCVVIWGIGNENRPGTNNTLAAKLTRQLDPTRPRVLSSQKAEDGGADVEFDDAHYITPQDINKAEHSPRRAKCPMIYTENPNVWEVRNGPDYGSLDLWRPIITRTWDELWQDDHVAGSFLWEWQDRAVADKCPTKYYYYFPDTGISLVKVKGVVDGFRNPRPEYYHIKMAQAPIALADHLDITGDGVTIEATNRYSFTDLAQLRVAWTLTQGSRRLAGGTAGLALRPRAHGPLRLDLPAGKLSAADTLRLDFAHPGGWNVATYQFALKPVSHPAPRVRAIGGLKFPTFNLVTGTNGPDGKGWHRLYRSTGELTNVKVQLRGAQPVAVAAAELAALPQADVQSLEADVLLQPGALPVGHLRADLRDGKFTYRLDWNGAKSDVFELGWVFHLPKGVERFSWDRQAPWSYYPPGHVGRPNGTAMPESAKVALTRVDRPDAFDFTSTKFDCNWAGLTDRRNRGLCFEFNPGQRQHVRGEIGPDGNCALVVNRCYSPPRDISSHIVPDLYTVLKKGDSVVADFQTAGQ